MSVGQRKKSPTGWVPDRIQTYDLANTGWVLYPLELRRTHGERGQIPGSYLHTARISNVDIVLCAVKEWNKQMWKWNNQHVTSVRQRNNLSPQQDSLVTCWLFHFNICFTELKILDFWTFQGHATVQYVVGKCLEWWQCTSKPFEQIHYGSTLGSIAMIIP